MIAPHARCMLGAAALLAALAAGCTGPAPRFFTLSSATGATDPALASRPDLGLVVGPLELARYLDRPEIVTRDGSHRLVVADDHRWGGSLRTDILRVVADDLGRLLGTPRIAVYPTEPRFPAAYRILLEVRQFEGVGGGQVALRVRWTVAAVDGGRALAVEESAVDQPIASAGFEALVAAERAALAALSREIAEKVAELAGR